MIKYREALVLTRQGDKIKWVGGALAGRCMAHSWAGSLGGSNSATSQMDAVALPNHHWGLTPRRYSFSSGATTGHCGKVGIRDKGLPSFFYT